MLNSLAEPPVVDRPSAISTSRYSDTTADNARSASSANVVANRSRNPHIETNSTGTQRDTMPEINSHSEPTPEAATEQVTEKDLVQVFKLLADETRLKILLSLQREGELHVSALCDRLVQSQPAVSHHLALLRDAGLIRPRRDGKHNYYSVRREHFERVMGGLFDSMVEPTAR